jgi:plasmid stabilization system protein ParE
VSLRVRSTPEADDQIGAIDEWWRRNRFAAPDLFFKEMSAAFEIIGHKLQIGRVYRQSPVPGTRRILLKGSRYHVYYVPSADEVRVLAVWHAQRGVGPPLRAS